MYQVITDFGDALEIFREAIQNSYDEGATEIYINVDEKKGLRDDKILTIDIIDNGAGLAKENVAKFFDVANSSKVDDGYIVKPNKHGYKGHGAKVFFNAKLVQISSKTKDGECWAAEMVDAVGQISEKGELYYSDTINPSDIGMELPVEWESGFMVRIISPYYFLSYHNRYKLNHINLRDYCKWFTLMGTIEILYNDSIKDQNTVFYLNGLLRNDFENKYNDIKLCDPVPQFTNTRFGRFEKILIGHHFPEDRYIDTKMKQYAKMIGSNKAYHHYYSRLIVNEGITTGSLAFRLIICIEGYETKRRYDLLLSRQGRANIEGGHTDGSRYGLWACKGGVPVQKIDDWIEGGRGVGTYTYMQAFVDCDEFQLTANRGFITNTDREKLDMIKTEVNKVFSSKKVKDAIQERQEWEELNKMETSLEAEKDNLKKRYNAGINRNKIIFPDGDTVLEPSKNRKRYSESETFVVFLTVMQKYPDLFKFKLLDYNTTKGIDFVVDYLGTPKYIELKGSLLKSVNHPFRLMHKFICYDIDVSNNEIAEDMEQLKARLNIMKNVNYESNDDRFNRRKYTAYVLEPEQTTAFSSIEIIQLKSFLKEVVGVTISE